MNFKWYRPHTWLEIEESNFPNTQPIGQVTKKAKSIQNLHEGKIDKNNRTKEMLIELWMWIRISKIRAANRVI